MNAEPFEAARHLFVRRWGEMGANWGISRTMAEIHALLYLSNRPLCTDDVMLQLQVSRGNTSMNLRELVNWGLIERVHIRGDRKEYFEAETDVWQMFETISRERRRREVQPIVETIERCREMIGKEKAALRGNARKEAEAYQKRFDDILAFCDMLNAMFNLMAKVGRSGLKPLAEKIGKLAK